MSDRPGGPEFEFLEGPQDTVCPACGGGDLFWGHTLKVPAGIAQGRLHTGDLTVVVFLGCPCGATIETMDLDEFLGGVQPQRRMTG